MSKENILGTLVVVVLKAQHLIDNQFYKQDPFAKLSLSGATKQTPPDLKGGQHPVWDAELRFPISKDASKNNRTLTISVFAEKRKGDDLLGEGTVDITETLKTGEFDDWVPLSLKGTQRGDVYLEMTFFASGPAPLTRRPSKFTSPSERLGRPQQPAAQRLQRVTSQPSPSDSTPQGQQGSWANSQETSRQGRPSRLQQVPLPGAWPGPSAQRQQSPPNPEPKQELLPSILRPGGPSRTGNTSPNPYPAQPHPAHQNSTVPLPGSFSPPQGHIPLSSSKLELEAQPPRAPRVSSYSGQESLGHGGYPSTGHATTQPSPQIQPELVHAHHNIPLQPLPQQQQQTQHLASQPVPYVSPYPPNNHLVAQTYLAPPASTPPVQSHVAAQSPSPSTFSYVATSGPASPAQSHIASQGPIQSHAATSSPVPPVYPQATNINHAPSPPSQSYPVTSSPPSRPLVAPSSPAPAPHLYNASSVPFASPYPAPVSPAPHPQSYLSPQVSVLAPPVQSRFTPSPSPPHSQPYFSPPSPMFPLPTSPPPMPSYGGGHPYEPVAPAPAPSFPAMSFPQPAIDYFGVGAAASPPPAPAPFSAPHDEPELPDPYLLKRYQTPLPLPPGSSPGQRTQPKPPVAAAVTGSTLRGENERAARESHRREEEESARVRREQEERDAELARSLDLELNLNGGGGAAGAREEPDKPLPAPPSRRAEAVGGGHRSGTPGAW